MTSPVICKRIPVSEDVLVRLFPSGDYAYVNKKDAYAYGAVGAADRALKGAAIFSVSEDLPLAVNLENFFVYSKFQGNGYARELMESSVKSMKNAGVKYIIYKEVSSDTVALLRSYNFATKHSFVPIVIDEKILYYSAATLLGGGFSRLVPRMKKSLDKVIRIDNPRDERIAAFNEREDYGLYKIRSRFDKELTGFYVEDDVILGVAKVYREGKKAILNNVFLDPGCDKREVFTALLVQLGVNVTMDDGIDEIVIQSVGDDRHKEIKNLFGKADREFPAIELVRYL